MAVISITIPDAHVGRVQDAVATRHGWTVGSGLTKAQFVKKIIIDNLKDDVRYVESQTARETHRVAGDAAAQTAVNLVDSEVTMT